MFRYRCPQCRQVLQAPEMRAGKATVCPKCSSKITIPADPAQWVRDESSPPVVAEVKSVPVEPYTPRAADFGDVMAPIHVGMGGAPAVPVAPPRVETAEVPSVAVVPKVVAPKPVERDPASTVVTSAATTPPPQSEPEVKAPPPPEKVSPLPPPLASDSVRAAPRRVVATSVAPTAWHGHGADDAVSFQQPLHLRSEMDIAAALTDVLTTRMKPPPKPPRDLYPSTAFWLLLTGVAIGLLVLTLFKPVDYLMAIQYIAVAQIVIGYIWIVVLVFRRNRSLGIKCAIPVITPWYLIQKRFRSYRPLRFVLTGALLLLCTVIAPRILADTRQFSGADQSNLPPPQRDIATLPEVEQLREYREKRQFVELINLLRRLDHMDPLYSKPAPQRVELAAELRRLVDPTVTTDSGLRAEALPAYARWAKDDARDMVLAAMQGHPDERRQAIQLLYKWPGPDVARVLASRLGNREESELVKKALINIGGPVVVQALIPLLRDKERDKMLHLAVLDLMTNPSIGNEEALQFLRVEKDKFTDESLNRQVEHTILKINENLRQKRGG